MNKQYFFSLAVLCITIPLLCLLAWNQFNWFQSRQKKEQFLIEQEMLEAGQRFSNRVYEELLFLPSLLRFNTQDMTNFATLFEQRYNFWKYYSLAPEILSDIYFVDTRIGSISKWITDRFEHQTTMESLPSLNDPSKNTITISITISNTDDHQYIIHCLFDYSLILKNSIPLISKDIFISNNLYAYRIINRDSNVILFESDTDFNTDDEQIADIEVPIITRRKNQNEYIPQRPFKRFAEIDPAFLSLFSDKQRSDFKPHFEEQIHVFFQKIIIQMYNKDGSLDHLAYRSTIQNGVLSFGVVLLLIFLMAGLTESHRRATALSHRQSEFIATISHELKTPLAVIQAAGQNLRDGIITDGKKISHYGSIIQVESSRLTKSINHFLVYAGTNTPNKSKYRPCDITQILQNVLRDTEDTRKDMDFRTEIDVPTEPILIFGETLALESVLRNLIQNVIIHAHQGKYLGIRITREPKNMNTGEERIILKIRDRGPGIPQSEQKAVFHPFVRGKTAVNEQIPGNGIGLNIVKRIVVLHRGTITLESKQDRGCVFCIILPIHKENNA